MMWYEVLRCHVILLLIYGRVENKVQGGTWHANKMKQNDEIS